MGVNIGLLFPSRVVCFQYPFFFFFFFLNLFVVLLDQCDVDLTCKYISPYSLLPYTMSFNSRLPAAADILCITTTMFTLSC